MSSSNDSLNVNIPYHFKIISAEANPAQVHTETTRDLGVYVNSRDQTE